MPKIGLACGGGGDVGVAFTCGVIGAIFDATGWAAPNADYIVGTSAGSILGAALRAGIPASDFHATMIGSDEVSPLGRSKLTDQVLWGENENLPPLARDALTNARLTGPELLPKGMRNPLRTSPISLAAAALPEGRLDNDFVSKKIEFLSGSRWPVAPLLITATQMNNGRRVVFSRNSRIPAPLPKAVAASCAIPSVFKPVTIDGSKYVDGGLHSSTNADVLLPHELDAVLIVAPMSVRRLASSAAAGPMRTASRTAVLREETLLRDAGTTVLTIHADLRSVKAMGVNIMDVRKRPRVSQTAYDMTLRMLTNEPRRTEAMVGLLAEAAKQGSK